MVIKFTRFIWILKHILKQIHKKSPRSFLSCLLCRQKFVEAVKLFQNFLGI